MKFTNLLLAVFLAFSCQESLAQKKAQSTGDITPNNFKGSDIERIRAAVKLAKTTTNKVVIPSRNSNGTNIWMLDSAILLPSNMTIVLDNCTIQLTDSSRDNIFRSDNVGEGVRNPVWNKNISIIGLGNVVLRGADNPRSTGDAGRTLSLDPQPGKASPISDADKRKENYQVWGPGSSNRVSYGSDAGKPGRQQNGSWRNVMILIAYVDGFKITNVKIERTHAWSISFERTLNADISFIRFNLQEEQVINGKTIKIRNRDGINLRQGCKFFRIDNISGRTQDDFIALSNLDNDKSLPRFNGNPNSTMVTAARWYGPQDDIEQVVITNISGSTDFSGVALRGSDSAGIHHIYIDGLIITPRSHSLMVGGRGYGLPSVAGVIHNIYATNVIGGGKSLILVEAPISNSVFMNSVYNGKGDEAVTYNIDMDRLTRVQEINVIKN